MRAFLLLVLALCIGGSILLYARDQHRARLVGEMNAATSGEFLALESVTLRPQSGCSDATAFGMAEFKRREVDANITVRRVEAELGPSDETSLATQGMINTAVVLHSKEMECLQHYGELIEAEYPSSRRPTRRATEPVKLRRDGRIPGHQ
jgi:hypothetical protein